MNSSGNHPANSRQCQAWNTEKEILKIKYTRNISFPQARKIVESYTAVFQSISIRLPKRGRKRRERIEESKNVQTTPTRTDCERSRPLPYCIQIVGRTGTGSLPSTIAPPDHPKESKKKSWKQYVCKLNSRTSIKKVWDMVRKIQGKGKSSSLGHLN